ncbi:DUF7619 domain-containing protein [Aureispira anguillae]|uniref:T9SS type A sorting domain-containing protein n=1 Tax=Aureispira anguillae TaxID=2864201 RepID=A0A915YL90_9BACT|nr:T9SS type A sorting domain-containing protein [Aureispira anguillae]BDS15001.1 T9SS type A sorting domain-containing protein [Aureispira anguillae]
MNKKYISSLLLIFILVWQVQAQEWTRKLDGPQLPSLPWASSMFDGEDVVETSNGGYVMAGIQSYATGAIRDYPTLVKVDAQGFTLWEKSYFSDSANVVGFSKLALLEMPNTNLLLAGANMGLIHLIQTNSLGDTLWTKTYNSYCTQGGGPCTIDNISLEATLDGNYILAIGSHITLGAPIDLLQTQLIKITPTGIIIWNKTYQDVWTEAMKPTLDGGYILAGLKDHTPMLYKVDLNGDSTWVHTYSGTTMSSLHSVVQHPDSSYVVVMETHGIAGTTPTIAKIDKTGANILWTTLDIGATLGGATGRAMHVAYDPAGYYVVTGSRFFPHAILNIMLDIAMVVKLDLAGNVLLERSFDESTANEGKVIRPTNSHGYIMVGDYSSKAYLVKIDSLLNRAHHRVQGYVYKDDNASCIQDSAELGLANWMIEIKRADGTVVYATTDSTGYYDVEVDTGAFTVKVNLPNTLWGLCIDSVNLVSTQLHNSDTLHFGARGLFSCPSLNVDISTSLLRRCSTTVYTVSYCNSGTADALNATIDVTLDTTLTLVHSSISWGAVTGGGINTFLFNMGTIPAGACGSFTITTSVSCYAQLGATHCVQAHIYPDTLCGNSSPFWDQSDIDVKGTCYGDSIVYFIRNIGTGPMGATRQYFVTEDHVMLFIRNFNLGPGDSIREVIHTTNGAAYRLQAEEDANHPHSAYSALGVTMCVADPLNSNMSVGVLGQYIEDDGSPAISIDCQQNVGSWDPNDKRGIPRGYGATHAIEVNTDLEYHIRFQNTGTDTAFSVVISDTLSSYLDPLTVVAGASSHPYQWELKDDGILVFTFNPIKLPDSTANEPASHGFVKFKIKQRPDLPLGTVIYNTAAIVFDRNPPVLTNTTFHTLEEDFIIDLVKIIDRPETTIDVYPNPFQEEARVVVKGEDFAKLEIRIVDAMGREVGYQQVRSKQTINIQRKNLNAGVYFFQLIGDDELIGTGKIIAK